MKIQDATFDNSSILKAKLYINGTIQGKSNGFFELRYKGNAINRIEPSPMVKIIKEEKRMTQEQDFLKYQAPTSPYPRLLEVERAEGSYIYTTDGKKYLDFVAGVSACTLGHCHCSSESHTRAMCYLYARDGLWRVHTKPAVDSRG